MPNEIKTDCQPDPNTYALKPEAVACQETIAKENAATLTILMSVRCFSPFVDSLFLFELLMLIVAPPHLHHR